MREVIVHFRESPTRLGCRLLSENSSEIHVYSDLLEIEITIPRYKIKRIQSN